MGKIIFLIFSAVLLFANQDTIYECNSCHQKFAAPPYKKIYGHYLLTYSSKQIIEDAMVDFLNEPSKEKSVMPKGMKRRFNPEKHPVYSSESSKSAVRYIIEQEDIIKRFKQIP